MLSRFLGLIREMLTAFTFGTSAAMSDFVVAFRIPNMFRALFGEGALSSAFVPVFMDTRKNEGDEEAWKVARNIITLLGAVLTGLVLLGMAACTALLQFPSLVENAPTVLPLARIMLPYMLFICLAALSQGILNSYHRFALPAFTPTLLNVVWIGFVIFVCPRMGDEPNEQIFGVAWGVFAAGIIQLAAQVPTLIKLGYRPGLSWNLRDPRVIRFLKLMGPTAIGQSVMQINVFINGIIARWAAPWAPAALYFAERLLYFPQGILATAMSTVLLPVFSGHAAEKNHEQLRDTLNHALRTLLFIMTPASLGLLVLAEPITRLLLQGGLFDDLAATRTTLVVQCYAPGLLIFGLAKVLVPAFYALQDTRTPYRTGLVSVGLNFGLNILLTLTIARDHKAASLAIAAVLSETFNGFALTRALHLKLGNPGWKQILTSATRSLACATAMAAAAYYAHQALTHLLEKTHLAYTIQNILAATTPDIIQRHALGISAKLTDALNIAATILIAATTYFGLAFVTKHPELESIQAALRRRRAARKDHQTIRPSDNQTP